MQHLKEVYLLQSSTLGLGQGNFINQKDKFDRNDKTSNNCSEIANIKNTFFSNIVTNLNILEYNDYENISRNISDPVLKATQYKSYPTIKSIKRVLNANGIFSFDIVDREEILKVGLSRSKKNCVICFIESPLKIMKNAFYFILKSDSHLPKKLCYLLH